MSLLATLRNKTLGRSALVRKCLVLAMLLLLVGNLVPLHAFADPNCDNNPTTGSSSGGLSLCQKDLYSSGVGYFDVSKGSTTQQCGDSSAATVSGSTNAEKIWNFFAGKGLKPVAIAGIMGNFHQEDSAFDPAEKQNYSTQAIPDGGDGHTGFGIAQWTSQDRQAGLFAKLRDANLGQYYGAGWGHPEKDKDIPPADIDSMLSIELNYAWDGDTTKISDIASQLNAATTTDGDSGSTVLFHRLYERSGDSASQIQQRVRDAGKFLQQFGGTSSTTGTTSSDSCAGALGGVSIMDDAIPWAMQFVSDTAAAYHPGGHTLNQQHIDSSMTGLYVTNDGAVSGGSCWGGTYCGQCTALSGWFVTKMTGYTYGGGNGGEVVGNLKAKGVPTGTEPRPFSVFSYATSSSAGHTGVVLGTLGSGTVITIENNWPGSGMLVIRKYNIKAEHPDATFAYVGDKLKVSGLSGGQ
jgi:hypothetical protein